MNTTNLTNAHRVTPSAGSGSAVVVVAADIDESIFRVAPDYTRIVILGRTSVTLDKNQLGAAFDKAVTEAALFGPSIGLWDTLFASMGLNPKKIRPAVSALARRAAAGTLRPTGVALVDAGTALSLSLGSPVGVHVLDELLPTTGHGEADVRLRLQTVEAGLPFSTLDGSCQFTDDGEVAWVAVTGDGKEPTVLTRHWVWRQGKIGSVDEHSQVVAINVDLLGPVDVDAAIVMARDLFRNTGVVLGPTMVLCLENPSGSVRLEVLSPGSRGPEDGFAGRELSDGSNTTVSDVGSLGRAPEPSVAMGGRGKDTCTYDFVDDLEWRGLIKDVSDVERLRQHLQGGSRSAYIGFDPTADSLHVGSLLQLITLQRFSQAGHQPIAVIGGGTGMIGDPSGKSAERTMLDLETLRHNQEGITQVVQRVADRAKVVNNFDWLGNLGFLDVLREVGKGFSVNEMMSHSHVRTRLDSEGSSISFTEFAYPLLQAMDFEYLFRTEGTTLQMGGQDQWANILAGVDLIRRRHHAQAFGLTAPLLTRPDGSKFGKSEGQNVWLTENRTSAFAFRQFWFNTDDRDVASLIRMFTFLSREECEAIEDEHARAPEQRVAQRRLALEMVTMVHGVETARRTEQAADALFSGDFAGVDRTLLDEAFAEAPTTAIDRSLLGAITIREVLLRAGLAASGKEADPVAWRGSSVDQRVSDCRDSNRFA